MKNAFAVCQKRRHFAWLTLTLGKSVRKALPAGHSILQLLSSAKRMVVLVFLHEISI